MGRMGKIGLAVALVVTAVGGVASAAGEDGPVAHGRRWGRMMRNSDLVREHAEKIRALAGELNLTDEQKAEIYGILKSHKDEISAAVKAVAGKRSALVEKVTADNLDETAIRKAADDLGEAIADASVLRAELRADIRQVLTEEQRGKADAIRKEVDDAIDKVVEHIIERVDAL